jgi:dTDP-4-dehydrorhamnose 3,5-epimerase
LDIRSYDIPDVKLLTPRRFGDDRGFFSEVWRDDLFREVCGAVTFVQDNHSYSTRRGTLRGLHFQRPPSAQGKLVRVIRGAVLDVAVDIRHGSPTFGRHIAVELSASNWSQLWVPPGFLHAFCTLQDDTEFLYKVTHVYSPADDGGVIFNDPDLGIDWPIPRSELTLSPKDLALPRLRDLPEMFRF